MLSNLRWFLPWLLLFAIAIAFRLPSGEYSVGGKIVEIPRKPFHADEANQAMKFVELLEEGTYQYDPHDHHGPTLYYAALPAAWAHGDHVDEEVLRWVPGVASLVCLLLLVMFRDGFSRSGLFLAACFIALCPAMVYYGRYFVQEMMLVAFTLGFLGSLWRYVRDPDWIWAMNIGLFVGLMHATKETFVLSCAAALVALPFMGPIQWKRGFRHLPVALFAAAAMSILFYSSFGTHWPGVADSVTTYFRMAERAGGEGHEKPWDYYAKLLAWQDKPGLKLTEALLLGLAALGALAALLRFKRGLGPFFLVYTLVLFGIYSAIAYKTPWLIVNIIPGLALLAGSFWTDKGWIGGLRWVAFPLVALGLVHLAGQTCGVSFQRHSDSNNPYAYTQTSTDLHRWLNDRLSQIDELSPTLDEPLRWHVIHENPWPIPWELRDRDVGYWPAVPERPDADIVLLDANLVDDFEAKAVGSYFEDSFGLREGELVLAYIRSDLWPKLIDPGGQTPEQGPFKHRAMASEWQLHLVSQERAPAAGAARAAFAELDRIEGLLSRYIPNSDISRIKKAPPGTPVIVSPETLECLQIAERMKAASDGAFDIAFRNAGNGSYRIDPDRMTVTTSGPGEFALDLGGIGKGYALDKMAEILSDEHGIEEMLVDGASTALARGDRAWVVGLAGRRIALKNGALSGSGLAVKGEHIIDPSTGEPATKRERAWVFAPTAAEADALSTAAMILKDPAKLDALPDVRVVVR